MLLLQEVLAALVRCLAVVARCSKIGPLYALLNERAVLGEFANSSMQLRSALLAMDLAKLRVVTDLQEALALTTQQLKRVRVKPSDSRHAQLVALWDQVRRLRGLQVHRSVLGAALPIIPAR